MSAASKILKIIVIVLFCCGFSDEPKTSVGTISFILGGPVDVSIMNSNSKVWRPAKLHSPVYNGDNIKTEKESRCEVKLNEAGLVRIGEKTTFKLQTSAKGLSDKSFLSAGKIWLNIKSLFRRKQRLAIQTPTAVCSVRGTIFRVEADSSTRVAVYDGTVDVGPKNAAIQTPGTLQQGMSRSLKPVQVQGPHEVPPPFEVSLDQWVQIAAGYQIEIRQDGKYAKSKIKEASDNQSDWVNWNQQRDGINK